MQLKTFFKDILIRWGLHKLTDNYVVANAKLKNALGIEKMSVSAKEGFVKTIESFRGPIDFWESKDRWSI